MTYYKLDMQFGFAGEKNCKTCPLHTVQTYQTSWSGADGKTHTDDSINHILCALPYQLFPSCQLVPVHDSIFSRIRAWLRKRKEQRKGMIER